MSQDNLLYNKQVNKLILESCNYTIKKVFDFNTFKEIQEIFDKYFESNINFILNLFVRLKKNYPCDKFLNSNNLSNPMFITHILLMLNDLESKQISNSYQIINDYIGEIKILRKNKNCVVYPKIFDFNKKIFGQDNMIFTKSIIMESYEYKLYYFDFVKNENINNSKQLINNQNQNQNQNQMLKFCPVLSQKIIDGFISSNLLIKDEDLNYLQDIEFQLQSEFVKHENNENIILGRHPEYIHFNRFLHQQITDLEKEINDYELNIDVMRLKIKELEDDIKILNNNYEFQYENKNYYPISYYINPKNIIGTNTKTNTNKNSFLVSEFKYIQLLLRIRYLDHSNKNYQIVKSKAINEKNQSNISTIYYEESKFNYSNTLLKYKHIILDMELKIRQLESNINILVESCL